MASFQMEEIQNLTGSNEITLVYLIWFLLLCLIMCTGYMVIKAQKSYWNKRRDFKSYENYQNFLKSTDKLKLLPREIVPKGFKFAGYSENTNHKLYYKEKK